MVVAMGRTSCFFIPSGNLFWPNHPVFPESSQFFCNHVDFILCLVFSLVPEPWPGKAVLF